MCGFVVLYDQRSRHSMHKSRIVAAGTAQRDTRIGTRNSACQKHYWRLRVCHEQSGSHAPGRNPNNAGQKSAWDNCDRSLCGSQVLSAKPVWANFQMADQSGVARRCFLC
jgi:hypothetical protein